MDKQRWRVATLGVSAHEECVLKSMLRLVSGRTRVAWEFSEDVDADVVLCEPTSALAAIAARRAASNQGPVCVALARSGQPFDPLPRAVQIPLRPSELVALLDEVSSKPNDAPRAEATTASSIEPLFTDALRHLCGSESDRDVVFRLSTRVGSLFVAFPERVWHTERDDDGLVARFAAYRGSVTIEALDGVDAASIRRDLPRRPLDPLLWACGLAYGADRTIVRVGATSRIRLRRWPDFGVIPNEPSHLALAAALGARPSTLEELVARTRLRIDAVRAFVNACAMCGLLECVEAASAPRRRITPSGWARVVSHLRTALGLAS